MLFSFLLPFRRPPRQVDWTNAHNCPPFSLILVVGNNFQIYPDWSCSIKFRASLFGKGFRIRGALVFLSSGILEGYEPLFRKSVNISSLSKASVIWSLCLFQWNIFIATIQLPCSFLHPCNFSVVFNQDNSNSMNTYISVSRTSEEIL